MRSTKSKSSNRPSSEAGRSCVRLPLALMLPAAALVIVALATSASAQRLNSTGGTGANTIQTGPVGGTTGIFGKGGGKVGIIGNPGGRPVTGAGNTAGTGPGTGTGNTGGRKPGSPGNTIGGTPGKGPGNTITGYPGRPGTISGGTPGGGKDRPNKPGWKPPVIVAVPPAVTTITPAIAGTGNAALGKGGGGAPNNAPIARRIYSDLPPAGEQRYVPDEVLIQLAANVPETAVEALAQRLRLTRLESHTSDGMTLYRCRIPDGRSVPDVIRSLQGLVPSARPNYLYTVQQQGAGEQPPPANQGAQGDHWQYALDKLRLPQAHALAKGQQVLVAVIDSGVDTSHPELAGMVVDSFDALKSDEKAHPHGTAIAGAIVSHARLMGAAPEARILAVRAFSAQKKSAEATTYSIVQGFDWAITRGARVINMSFTGPRDPSIEERVIRGAKNGIIMVAAAGNAGPKAPEAYPAAYPNVIAVTATDAEDKLFQGANRGRYIAVAAPGVDLLLPAPEAAYQVTTGTSFAAAEVSGIVALILERSPGLGHDGVRKALTATARDLGPRGFDTQFGAGLVDAYQAIRSLEPAVATTGARVNPAARR
jgi:subtilase family protein/fervidolysin-like protein